MYYGGVFDWDNAKKQLAYLNEEIVAPNFWDDAEKAQQTLRKQQFLDSNINKLTNYQNNLLHIIELIGLAELENDEDLLKEGEVSLLNIQKELKEVQIEFLLNGETDGNDAYLEIHPGAGGTESQDWASMLLRMYLRWAEKKSFKTQLIDMQNADEAGIKSATILIKGTNAYGLLKTESGVHRLVRISPFDSNARRHTSFASIWVYPVIDENIAVEIAPNEVRIDTYRASGAGGQHVNTTDSAVRITHIPTGIVVQCQSERSQHKNKATAWNMLRARLYEEEVKKQQLEADVIQANKSEIGWGQQIRSYILQPYQLVKDTRTKIEHTNPQSVLDGDLDSFIKAALASQTY